MKLHIKILCLLSVFLIASCAKIPVQSVVLMESICDEGKRMHETNKALVNEVFTEKKKSVDKFIKDVYTPRLLENFKANIPKNTDWDKEFPNMVISLMPHINGRRDSIHNTLEVTKLKIIKKLDEDYLVYNSSCQTLKNLLESAAKVDEANKMLIQKTEKMSNNKINIEDLSNRLDSFIFKSGNWSDRASELNESIQNLINP